jgi:hypothetical protein
MTSGGSRIGAGRKEKYDFKERQNIIDVFNKIWNAKKANSEYLMISLGERKSSDKEIEIWKVKIKSKKQGNDSSGLIKSDHTGTNFSKMILIHKRPLDRDECLKLVHKIVSNIYPNKYHRINTIDKIWKTKNI